MEWLRIRRYNSSRELICRKEDIDYIAMQEEDDIASIHLKNGKCFDCTPSGLWDHLVPVNEKNCLNALYGMSVARPCPDQDKCYLCGKENEIQDLKLENDRLKKRDEIMHDFICSISCTQKICPKCKLYRPEHFERLGAKCAYLQGSEGLDYIRNEANELLNRLEDL